MPGWIKLHRKLSRSDMWTSEKFTRGQAWVDLMMRASFHGGFTRVRGIRIDYERGQYCASMKGLADRWKWSQGKVKRFLSELKNDEQIEYQNSGVTTLITIRNYAQYQDDDEQNREQTGSKRGANEEQTRSKRRHSKKEEEGKNEKKDVYLEFVKLTAKEHDSLVEKVGKTKAEDLIVRLNGYVGSKGDKYKSHYHTMLNWHRSDEKDKPKDSNELKFVH